MKLSVIIPVYNVEEYVEECLESVAKQTYKDLEVIIIDDGSTDGSSEICKRYAEKYNHFSYTRKENGGLMSAWVTGVKMAKGDYIGFVDSDDFVDPAMYEKMLARAEMKNVDVVMCGHCQLFPDATQKISTNQTLQEFYQEKQMDYIRHHAFSSLFEFNVSNERWNKIFRRQLILENLIYCADLSKFHEAKYITPACLFSAKSFSYINEPLYILRARAGSNSHVVKPELVMWTEHLYATQKRMLEDKNVTEYLPRLEESKIDYFRIVYQRCRYAEKQGKLKLARELLTEENISLLRKYKNKCLKHGGITGKILYYSMTSKSPAIIAGAMSLFALRK